jgi:hypothetical protein
MSGEFGNVGVEFHRTDSNDGWGIRVIEEQSPPASVQALQNWFAENAGNPSAELRWNISWSAPHRPRQVTAAIYQSAYLLMFAYFGYDFVLFRPEYDPLRQQILRPDEAIWPGRILVMNSPSARSLTGEREVAVVFVREPSPAVLVILRFRPAEGGEQFLAVPLPPPGESAVPHFDLGTVSGAVIPYQPDAITHGRGYYTRQWRSVRPSGG